MTALAKPHRICLLGAGFSHNWGGWLADEAFEYLIGTPEVLADPGLLKLLWRYQDNGGGFEDALAELQEALRSTIPSTAVGGFIDNNVPLRAHYVALRKAVERMFDSMNEAYNQQSEFQHPMQSFLGSFDAIFTLNQDMLLERLYARQLSGTAAMGNHWDGATLPGMRQVKKIRHSGGVEFWSEYLWEPLPTSEFPAEPGHGLQPIYKLHGSSQWQAVSAGTPILIIGGEKSRAIQQFEVLEWYAKCFDWWLARGTRLMVIGYGFRDPHINKALLRGESAGLQLFIVDPVGPSIAAERPALRDLIRTRLIGASRRPITQTMLHDPAERAKVMRFFDS